MWPWLLGSAGLGAAIGGYQGYQRSGGDLGATLSGAATGGLLGGVTGRLGSATGGLAAGRMAKLLPIETLLKKQGMGLGLTGVEKAMMAAPGVAGVAANIGTQLAGGALLAPVAAAAGNLAGQAVRGPAQLAAGALGYRAPGSADYTGGGGAVPPVGQFGAGGTLSDPLDVLKGTGMGRRLEYLKDAEAARDAMRVLYPEVAKISETAKKREFERNMAAAGIRQNIATAAQMLMQSQLGAQQMGQTAAQQAGQALTQQYQYS